MMADATAIVAETLAQGNSCDGHTWRWE